MQRYTVKSYIRDLNTICNDLAMSGSIKYPVYGGRYNMTYSDLIYIRADGGIDHHGCVECGTPREALTGAYKVASSPDIPDRLTREQCKVIAAIAGIDFSDFHVCTSDQVRLLLSLAKKSKYKAPSNRNFSQAHCFFNHLRDRVKTDVTYIKDIFKIGA